MCNKNVHENFIWPAVRLRLRYQYFSFFLLLFRSFVCMCMCLRKCSNNYSCYFTDDCGRCWCFILHNSCICIDQRPKYPRKIQKKESKWWGENERKERKKRKK